MDERVKGGWGELQKQEQQELTYAEFMDMTSYHYQLKRDELTRKIKRQQQAAERYRRKQRIKGRLITAAWAVLIVGFAAAAIVIH